MLECRWLEPTLVGQFEFLEWTADNHLRHTRFVALRDDKDAKPVRREYHNLIQIHTALRVASAMAQVFRRASWTRIILRTC